MAFALALACAPTAAIAQADSAVATFLASARDASARFRDRTVAAAEGYRVIGPDFPSMGEHWVNIALVAEGSFDPRRPQILEYAMIDGRPELVGVSWALPVGNGRTPPDFPRGSHAWHYHGGSVDDESFVASHGDPGHHAPAVPTLAVMHAWVWAENPDGMFETDNWQLPWRRLGLTGPAGAPVGAAKLLSLAAGGLRYFTLLARAVGKPDSAESAAVLGVLTRAGDEARATADALRARGAVSADDAARLAARWRELWNEVRAAVGPAARERLAALGS